jgi:gas vesicle protein
MNKASAMGIGLLSGLAVGAAIGILTAPKSGVDTRSMLKEKATNVREQAGDTVSRWRNRRMRAMEGATPIETEL